MGAHESDDPELAAGREVIERIRAGQMRHVRDFVIRHHETGRVVARIPAKDAAGLCPVVCNGLVVGCVRQTEGGWEHPLFRGDGSYGWVQRDHRENWACIFNKRGVWTCNKILD